MHGKSKSAFSSHHQQTSSFQSYHQQITVEDNAWKLDRWGLGAVLVKMAQFCHFHIYFSKTWRW